MAKRHTNRAARGLAVVLGVVVLVGGSWLFIDFESRLPVQERLVTLLPRSNWGFGRQQRIYYSLPPPKVPPVMEWMKLWCFRVRLK
jgi:hypothetical protein